SQEVDFNREIRPILSDKCYACHGPDSGQREADLRLDLAADALRDRGGYRVVDTAQPESSVLLDRIFSSDELEKMPPSDHPKQLTDNEQQKLRTWIEQGAEWKEHWSYLSPSRKTPPSDLEPQDWSRNFIDQFIAGKLADTNLAPAPEADKRSLVRRLYFDLIGLPPTLEEAEAFLKQFEENDSIAINNTINSLLARPEYGEKWARSWLDLARYADTNGYEKDRDRSIWPYRDWVVEALNRDLPFDQFTIEQIAGDMLPNATTEQRIATGFHRNTMLNEEGGIDPLEFRYHAMTDRVATTGTTWLGLTLGCCQCHTHKYDPISHTEYFQIMAFLNNADEPTLELLDEDYTSKWDKAKERAEKLIEELPSKWPMPSVKNEEKRKPDSKSEQELADQQLPRDQTELVDQAFASWLERERSNSAHWEMLRPTKATSNLPILTIQEDGAVFASGDTAKRDDYYVTLMPQEKPIHAIEIEALPDERLPARGPGSTYYEGTLGDFYLTEIDFKAGERNVEIVSASESFAANRYGKNPVSATLAFDGDIQTGWSVHGRQGERHVAVFVFKEPIPPGEPIQVHMAFGRHFASSFGLFRFHGTEAKHSIQARDFTREQQALLMKPADTLDAEDARKLRRLFLLHAPELKEETDKIRALQKPPSTRTTLVMRERPRNETRPTFRHHRGEYLQAEEKVTANPPAILHGM
ncbi:MAG: DUF1549 domain-containing protein, partial [Planctomycetota bacterium]